MNKIKSVAMTGLAAAMFGAGMLGWSGVAQAGQTLDRKPATPLDDHGLGDVESGLDLVVLPALGGQQGFAHHLL